MPATACSIELLAELVRHVPALVLDDLLDGAALTLLDEVPLLLLPLS